MYLPGRAWTWSGRTAIAERALVLDASVLFEYLAPGPALEDVAPLFGPDLELDYWVPDHSLLEVTSALRKRYLRDPEFSKRSLAAAILNLLELGLIPVPSSVLIERTLVFVDDLTSYDASYVVLAEARGIPLCTLDRGLARTAEARGLHVLGPGTSTLARWIDSFPGRP